MHAAMHAAMLLPCVGDSAVANATLGLILAIELAFVELGFLPSDNSLYIYPGRILMEGTLLSSKTQPATIK